MISISSEAISEINSLYQNIGKKDNCSGCLASFMYYDTIEEQIASVVYSIVKGHYFFEGNKRTGFTVFIILCKDNGLTPTNKDLVKLFEEIASTKLSIPEVAEMLFDKKFPKKSSWIKILSKIVKTKNKYQVQSESGKNLGTYDTKEEAEKRLRQVEYFKHKDAASKQKIKKTSPKVKKTVNKPAKKVKTAPKKVLTKNPTRYTKTNKIQPKSQNKPVSKKYKIRTNTGEWPHQDVSLPVFEDLLEQGYNMATFVAHPNACVYCQKRNGMTWSLADFISNLQYDAPIFEKAAHVNAYSKMKVWDKNGELEPVFVDYNGNITY